MDNPVISTWGSWTKSENLAEQTELPILSGEGSPFKALMGWDGLAVLDDSVNVIDMCREFVEFAYRESCGQCFPCRLGFTEMLAILEGLCQGQGSEPDVDRLQRLAEMVRGSSKCDIGRTSPRPLLDALRTRRNDFLAAAGSGETIPRASYHGKVTAPCIQSCPSHVDVPRYLEQIRFGHTDEAIDVVLNDAPLPGTLGRVCVRLCEFNCRRALLDDPLAVKSLKRFAADCERACGALHEDPPESFKEERVAIIGAGPAGLSCAYYLARQGYRSTLFEMLHEPGGMAAVGIPDYRLPRQILREEAARIERMGAEIRYGVRVGVDLTMEDLHQQGYAAVFLGVGAPNSMSMRCEGEDAGYQGFMQGIHFLRDIADGRRPLEGTKIAVVGGGNVAMDCVRSALRVGFTDVNVLYRRTETEMPADQVEIDEAREEGVHFHFLVLPVKILADEQGKVTGLECQRMELGEPDDSGRRRPVPIEGSNFVLECDAMVPAIGQRCSVGDVVGTDGVEITRWGTLEVDELSGQSQQPMLFSGGDCVTGADTLIAALGAGKRAAHHIARFLDSGDGTPDADDYLEQLLERLQTHDRQAKPAIPGDQPRLHPHALDPMERIESFDEVEGALNSSEAFREASRCLRCYCLALVAQ